MKTSKVTMVRIYLTESTSIANTVIHYLHNEAKLRGITVFRAIKGYGQTGEQVSSWIDVSLNLPITLEFFDSPEKIASALEYLSQLIKPEHIVFWEANQI